MFFHFSVSATNSLHLLTPSTWRFLSTSSFYLFLGLPLLLVPSSSSVKIFLGILSSSILSRWPNQLILCPFIHFTIFSPLFISSSSRFVGCFHSPFLYIGISASGWFHYKKHVQLFCSNYCGLPLTRGFWGITWPHTFSTAISGKVRNQVHM